MAELPQELKVEKTESKKRNRTGRKAKQTTSKKASSKSDNETVESKTTEVEPEAAAQGRWRSNGAEHLKSAADKLVARNCQQLAEKLLKKALDGRTDSARLLVTLAEGKKPRKAPVKKPRQGASVAVGLNVEPEWPGTEPEQEGSREP